MTDVHAPYYGLEVTDERALIPDGNSRIGATRFADWLSHSVSANPRSHQPEAASA